MYVASEHAKSRKTLRQHQKRYETHVYGDDRALLRPSTSERVYSAEQTTFIMSRHQMMTYKVLTERFNYIFRESPERSQSSIQSYVQRQKKSAYMGGLHGGI